MVKVEVCGTAEFVQDVEVNADMICEAVAESIVNSCETVSDPNIADQIKHREIMRVINLGVRCFKAVTDDWIEDLRCEQRKIIGKWLRDTADRFD